MVQWPFNGEYAEVNEEFKTLQIGPKYRGSIGDYSKVHKFQLVWMCNVEIIFRSVSTKYKNFENKTFMEHFISFGIQP